MADPFSGFSRSSSRSGWSGSLHTPRYTALKPYAPTGPKKIGGVGGFFTHLAGDIRDAAFGLPASAAMLGKGLWDGYTDNNWNELKKLGTGIYKSAQWQYEPLVKGDIGEFAHRFNEHPLGPILDAVTIATLGAGAVGQGARIADTAASAAARRGLVSTETASKAARFGNKFRPISQEVNVIEGAPSAERTLHPNMFTRAWKQQAPMAMGEIARKAAPKLFGEGGRIRETGMAGFQQRWLNHELSRREVATAGTISRYMRSAKGLFKDETLGAHDVANILDQPLRDYTHGMAMSIRPDQLLDKKSGYLQNGLSFLSEHPERVAYPVSKAPEHMGAYMEKFAGRMVVKKNRKGIPNLALAKRDALGNYMVVRDSTYRDGMRKVSQQWTILHDLYKRPTTVWKWLVLANAPRYFVNNVVGNSLMLAMATNPVSTIHGIYDTMRDLHGERVARRSMNEVDKAVRNLTGDWIDKYHSAATYGFSHDIQRDMRLTERYGPNVSKGAKVARTGLYGVTHAASDTLLRRIALNWVIRRHPTYRAYYKSERALGLNPRAAHLKAAESASQHQYVRSWAAEQVNNVLGQYHYYTPAGKMMKNIVPFYGWDRAIMRHAWVMASERPYEAALLVRAGQEGEKRVQDYLGTHIPDFLKSSIPLELLGIHSKLGERLGVVSTGGINPYAAIPSVTDTALALTGLDPKARPNEAFASQINPLITGAYEWASGTSLLSGAKVKKPFGGVGGLFGSVYGRTLEGTPGYRLLDTALTGAPQPKRDAKGRVKSPLLYKGDFQQQWTSFLGVPIKKVSETKAEELYRRQEGLKKPPGLGTFHAEGLTAFKSTLSQAKKPSYSTRRRSRSRAFTVPQVHTSNILPKPNW